jgi:hypothetical protein
MVGCGGGTPRVARSIAPQLIFVVRRQDRL